MIGNVGTTNPATSATGQTAAQPSASDLQAELAQVRRRVDELKQSGASRQEILSTLSKEFGPPIGTTHGPHGHRPGESGTNKSFDIGPTKSSRPSQSIAADDDAIESSTAPTQSATAPQIGPSQSTSVTADPNSSSTGPTVSGSTVGAPKITGGPSISTIAPRSIVGLSITEIDTITIATDPPGASGSPQAAGGPTISHLGSPTQETLSETETLSISFLTVPATKPGSPSVAGGPTVSTAATAPTSATDPTTVAAQAPPTSATAPTPAGGPTVSTLLPTPSTPLSQIAPATALILPATTVGSPSVAGGPTVSTITPDATTTPSTAFDIAAYFRDNARFHNDIMQMLASFESASE